MLKNIHLKYLVLVLVVFLFILSISILNNRDLEVENKIVNEGDKNIELDFNKELNNFENYYKKALVFSGRGDQKHALLNSKESLQAWENIYKTFKNNKPLEYKKTVAWKKKLEEMYEIDIESNRLIENKKLREANLELKKIRIMIRAMRQKNDIKNINDQLLDFYEIIIPVAGSESKEDTAQYMKNMKLSFLRLKELNLNEEYNKKIGNIEKSISGIDSLIGNDFRKSQNDLLRNFEELYISVK